MARERAAKELLSRLSAFTLEIGSYVQDMGETTAANRRVLRQLWETPPKDVRNNQKQAIDSQSQKTQSTSDSRSTRNVVKSETELSIVDPSRPSHSAGITARLRKVGSVVTSLKVGLTGFSRNSPP